MAQTVINKRNNPRSYPWRTLVYVSLLLGFIWGFIQVILLPILPYFYLGWWVASADAQFLIGRFLARRLPFRPSAGQPIPQKAFVAGVGVMFLAYFAAQWVVPLAVQGIPMVGVHSLFLPPLLIEGIILAAGLAGFFMALQRNVG